MGGRWGWGWGWGIGGGGRRRGRRWRGLRRSRGRPIGGCSGGGLV